MIGLNLKNKNISKLGQKLLKFDKNGKIYFPSLIRRIFRDYHFYLEIEGGKIVLDPIKVDDGVGRVECGDPKDKE